MDVSIIIPTKNKQNYLNLTLSSFIKQTMNKNNYEIIIVNDNSIDETENIITKYKNILPIRYIKLNQDFNRAKCRNIGINESSGSIILFIDDDIIISPNFIEEHLISHKKYNHSVVLGRTFSAFTFLNKNIRDIYKIEILNLLQKGFFNKEKQIFTYYLLNKDDYLQVIYDNDIVNNFDKIKNYMIGLQHYYSDVMDKYGIELENFYIPWTMFITNNVSVQKDDLLSVDLFDENFNGWGCEDNELGYRFYLNRKKFINNSKAKAYHQVHSHNRIQALKEFTKNYKYFCNKFKTFEVFLQSERILGRITLDEYNNIVRDYIEIKSKYGDIPLLKKLFLYVKDYSINYAQNEEYVIRLYKDYIKSLKENINII